MSAHECIKLKSVNVGNFTGIITSIRLPLMTIEELLNDVRGSSLVCSDALLDAIKVKNESRNINLKYRGFMCKFKYGNDIFMCLSLTTFCGVQVLI